MEPTIVQKGPVKAEVETGKTVWWCSCGLSASQPFCDGSHRGSGFVPTAYTPALDGPVFFCGCKRSATAPLCDGTHRRL